MGLFDKVFGGMAASKNLDKTEGFAGVLPATVAADGHVSDEEAAACSPSWSG
jgi:hypothetical protein